MDPVTLIVTAVVAGIATANHGSAAATGRGAAAVGDGSIQITGDVSGGVSVGLPPRER
ncbi:MAG: hypothetical protein JXM73_23145 [Anaerolineae bacterium]|nr:hypothetical protein [Anaerolineae bacterium]